MAKIYIYGEIYGGWSAPEVRNQLMSIPQGEEIEVYINSPGGSVNEGFAIHDILATAPNPITTIGEGMVGSIATVIFLAGAKRKLTKNCQFFVHNPIIFPSDSLTADELEKYAEMMREVELGILDFYAQKLGLKKRKTEELYKLMKAETTLSADQAIEFGFATELMPELMAMAKFDKGELKQMSTIWERLGLKSEAKKEEEIEVIDLKLATDAGITLVIDTKEKHPAVEMSVLDAEGNKAGDGDYFIPAMGKNIIVENGKIKDILNRDLEAEKEVNDEEVEALVSDFEKAVDARVEDAIKGLSEKLEPTIQNFTGNLDTVKALTKNVADQSEIIADLQEKDKSKQSFIEVQSKAIEDQNGVINSLKEENEKQLSELKAQFEEYQKEVEEVLTKVVGNYVPPKLNNFKEDSQPVYELTPIEKARADIEKRTKKF